MPKLRRTSFVLLIVLFVSLSAGVFSASAAPPPPTVKVFVDTDIGVDDATAIAWLLNDRSTNILGFTTVAGAVQQFPADMVGVHVIVLAGSRGPGNRTPVSEFNAFSDPQALDIVLEHQLDVTLVTEDAFDQVKVDSTEFPQELTRDGGAMGQFLASALTPYFLASTQGAGGQAAIPDAAAAIYALRPELGTV